MTARTNSSGLSLFSRRCVSKSCDDAISFQTEGLAKATHNVAGKDHAAHRRIDDVDGPAKWNEEADQARADEGKDAAHQVGAEAREVVFRLEGEERQADEDKG
jgi:hypothetical protein